MRHLLKYRLKRFLKRMAQYASGAAGLTLLIYILAVLFDPPTATFGMAAEMFFTVFGAFFIGYTLYTVVYIVVLIIVARSLAKRTSSTVEEVLEAIIVDRLHEQIDIETWNSATLYNWRMRKEHPNWFRGRGPR